MMMKIFGDVESPVVGPPSRLKLASYKGQPLMVFFACHGMGRT